jgi:hypothetical protein
MTLEVTSAFRTLIGRLRVPDADAMNQDRLYLTFAWPARRTAANDITARRRGGNG